MQNRVALGVLSLCLGALVFSLQDPIIKAISATYPLSQALVVRAAVAVPFLLWFVHIDGGLASLAAPHRLLLSIRAVLQFLSYALYYMAIAGLPLADAVALFFIAPLFIVALAWPYLGEKVGWQAFVAVCVGLSGTLVMLNPGAGVFNWAALLSLAAALLYAMAQLMARRLSVHVTASVMAFYQNAAYLIGGLLLAALLVAVGPGELAHPSLKFLTRGWVWPTPTHFLMMAACGVIAAIGMTLLSQAYRLAPANTVATFEYVGILWPTLWGFLFFAEVPQARTVLGAALIVAAGVFALNAGRRRSFAVSPTPPEPARPASESRPA